MKRRYWCLGRLISFSIRFFMSSRIEVLSLCLFYKKQGKREKKMMFKQRPIVISYPLQLSMQEMSHLSILSNLSPRKTTKRIIKRWKTRRKEREQEQGKSKRRDTDTTSVHLFLPLPLLFPHLPTWSSLPRGERRRSAGIFSPAGERRPSEM